MTRGRVSRALEILLREGLDETAVAREAGFSDKAKPSGATQGGSYVSAQLIGVKPLSGRTLAAIRALAGQEAADEVEEAAAEARERALAEGRAYGHWGREPR